MSNEKIKNQKEALLQKMLKLQSKEKVLNDKARKIKIKKLIELGEIVEKSGIDHLDSLTLLGAFSEIMEASHDSGILNIWSTKGRNFIEKNQKISLQQLIISFQNGTSDEAKKILKKHHFRWYAFRNEWYGRGKKESFEDLLKNHGAKIEIVS